MGLEQATVTRAPPHLLVRDIQVLSTHDWQAVLRPAGMEVTVA